MALPLKATVPLVFLAAGMLVAACGGSIQAIDEGDAGLGPLGPGQIDPLPPSLRDAGKDVDARKDGAAKRDGAVGPDATSPYVEPPCPDVPRPPPTLECDPHAPQGANGCSAGQGCYPFVRYPSGSCDSEQYGAVCAPAGSGSQGDACDGVTSCAAGFVCVISGAGTQCVKMCELAKPGTCPEGFVCEPVDVAGIGACF